MKTSGLAVMAAFALLFSVCTPEASSQAVFGSISGTVTDPSSPAVAKPKATATEEGQRRRGDRVQGEIRGRSADHEPELHVVRTSVTRHAENGRLEPRRDREPARQSANLRERPTFQRHRI